MSVALKQVIGYLGRPPITNAELELIRLARALQVLKQSRSPNDITQTPNTENPKVKIYRDNDK